MSTNEWHKREYNGASHGWDVEAAKRAQRSKIDKTRQMWQADRYLQRQIHALKCKRMYGWNDYRTARAGWFALALLGLKPTKYQLAAHPCLERFM